VGNQTSTSFLAYLASRSIFFPHESAGRGAYLSFLSQSAFFFGKSGARLEWTCVSCFHALYNLAMIKILFVVGFLLLPACLTAQLNRDIKRIAVQAHALVGVSCSLPGVALDCNLNANEKLPMQSVYKFPIGITILHAVEQGRLALSQPVEFLPSDAVRPGQHSPLRDMHPQGGVTVPLQELLHLAVSESDGTASDILLRVLGGPAVVDKYIRGLGVQGVAVVDTEKTLGKDGKAQYRDTSSAAAMVGLLRLLADDSPLSSDHTALLLRLMTQGGTSDARIKGLLPPNTEVAHKTGTSGIDNGITHATNDVGLITMRNGKKLAIAVMIKDSPASEEVRERVIAQVTKAVWSDADGKLIF
jgi:beta-lactamase class A